jgi:hypothetical protein
MLRRQMEIIVRNAENRHAKNMEGKPEIKNGLASFTRTNLAVAIKSLVIPISLSALEIIPSYFVKYIGGVVWLGGKPSATII